MDDYIHHISEKDFEEVCKKVISKTKDTHTLRYIPADWEWTAYPDIGFSTITDDHGENLTLGYHRYERMPGGKLLAEEIIRRNSDDAEFIIDTKEQLLALIEETFGLTGASKTRN